MINLKGKRVLVVGLAKSGVAAIRLVVKLKARVFATDSKSRRELAPVLRSLPKQVQVAVGSPNFFLDNYDLIVISPGIPWNHPSLVKARKKGIPVWPELELAWRCVKPGKTIAVTGTNGKTTTTALIGHILKTAGRSTLVGGNIGTPLSAMVPRVSEKTNLVLEVSSYQLEAHHTFHPNVGVFLNLTPDHLARHRTMAGYAKAKARLFSNFTSRDTAVLNRRDVWCRRVAKRITGRKVWFPASDLRALSSGIRLPGQHNVENAMAAAAAARAVGVSSEKIRKGIRTFKGVRHRLERVRNRNGVWFVNDSKATNVDSTVVALRSFSEPLTLILGGEHKGSPYTPLLPLIKKKVRQILTIGESAPLIKKDLGKAVPLISCKALPNAVKTAAALAKPGEVVLLSPACASFDQYNNYEERGDHFVKLVRAL
jgi:UDP-N-acetylmuramoylalanine--D-glutamate ligase